MKDEEAEPGPGTEPPGSAVTEFEAAPSLPGALSLLLACWAHPVDTFSRMGRSDRLLPAIVFAMAVGVGLWTMEIVDLSRTVDRIKEIPQVADLLRSPDLAKRVGPYLPLDLDRFWQTMWLLGLPFVPLGFCLTVIATHLCLLVVGSGGGGATGTCRVVAYSTTGSLLALVPLVGGLLVMVWVSVQLITGLAGVHRSSTTRVVVALSLPLAALGVVLVAAVASLLFFR
ncbi:MAG: hypothetical protein HY815_02790 [Candidatus Riflebacteria bacterium]|nr:hypothetical protein [Candidatus Riflebacteria bacterium]